MTKTRGLGLARGVLHRMSVTRDAAVLHSNPLESCHSERAGFSPEESAVLWSGNAA
jgi:hypothetical protein